MSTHMSAYASTRTPKHVCCAVTTDNADAGTMSVPQTCLPNRWGPIAFVPPRLYIGPISASPMARPYPRDGHAVGDAEIGYPPMSTHAMRAHRVRTAARTLVGCPRTAGFARARS